MSALDALGAAVQAASSILNYASSQDFIEEDVPMSRVLAVTNEPAFMMDFYFKSQWTRPMPMYSVPGLVDHFKR